MKKNIVKLNEGQLRQIVKESVKKVLNEGTYNDNLNKAWKIIENEIGSKTFLYNLFLLMDEDDIIKYLRLINTNLKVNRKYLNIDSLLYQQENEDNEY